MPAHGGGWMQNRFGIIIVVTIILVTMVMFASLGLLYYSGIVRRLALDRLDWTGIGALAAIVTIFINLILLASVVVGFQNIREGQNSRTAELLRWAMEQMDKVKDDERKLRDLARRPYASWRDDKNALKSAQAVNNAYSRMAYLANKGLIDIAHFKTLWGVNICVSWFILEEHIKSERRKFSDKEELSKDTIIRPDFNRLAETFIKEFDRENPKLLDSYLASFGRARSRLEYGQFRLAPLPQTPDGEQAG